MINNASAISLTNTPETSVKRFDLMMSVNGRGTWLTSKLAMPHLIESAKAKRNPHIIVLCPPPDLDPKWFGNHVAYSMAKYAMSMCVIGLAEELKPHGVAVNGLWPLTTISTSAITNIVGIFILLDSDGNMKSRSPQIMADAAFAILHQPGDRFTGNFCIDENILRLQGVTDFAKYRDKSTLEHELTKDFFLPENPFTLPPMPVILAKL